MSDDRPLPQYGEYATPEQQAAAMGRKYVAPEPEMDPAAPAQVLPQAYLARPPGYANRFLTVFLLGLGAVSLLGNIPTFFSLATALKGAATAAGVASVTVPASANAAGIPILIANVVVYLAAVLLSIRALRRGRVSFYIPVAGFVIFVLVAWVIVAIYIPGYVAQLSR